MVDLSQYSRCDLGHFPTRLELLPNLSRQLGGPKIYIKRDDCTGLASGGNKTRKLEFLVAAAIAAGHDILITSGALQSNHVRQTIAAAARVRLECQVVVQQKVNVHTDDYNYSGNVLLDELMGGKIAARVPVDGNMEATLTALMADLEGRGHRPLLIPVGGSTPLGVLGYVECAHEMLAQSAQANFNIDHVVHATGSGGTQAGLIIGMRAGGSAAPIHGISVGAPGPEQEQRVWGLVQETLAYGKLPATLVARGDVVANSNQVGDGYGMPTEAMIEAVELVAQSEGILLDPVYSGKAMAGLIDLVRTKQFKPHENVVFIHTGGMVGLFAYRDIFGHGGDVSATKTQ